MAKKKGGKSKGKSVARRSKSMLGDFDVQKILGIAGGLYGGSKLDSVLANVSSDPKIQAVLKVAIGELGPKQPFVRNMVKDPSLLNGLSSGLIAKGVDELLVAFNVAGYQGLSDNDELAVVLEGDVDTVNGDVDTVNADVLGDDDMSADVLGEDLDDEDDYSDGDYDE